MTQLHEQYRPQLWSDVVGQREAVKKITTLAKRGLGGRAYFISGKSGTGKTTIAMLLAAEVADDWGIDELDASSVTVKTIQDMERRHSGRGLGKGGYAVVVNESHGLRRDVIRQLLVTLERIPEHVVWVFTTTIEGQEALFEDQIDAHPLLSRCIEMPLRFRGLKGEFAQHCMLIAEKENLSNKSLKDYMALAEDCNMNMRMMLQKIEAGDMCPEESLL